jgi:hypothetical protein
VFERALDRPSTFNVPHISIRDLDDLLFVDDDRLSASACSGAGADDGIHYNLIKELAGRGIGRFRQRLRI